MSQLKVDEILDSSGGSNSVLYGVASPAGSMGFRNRIINGDCRIDQRNAGAAVTTTGSYPVDRFSIENVTDGAFSAQQDSTAPVGFVNSLKFTATTADASLSASQYTRLRHEIEGYNIADLGWGTANAKTVTLSFWVRSSLTGTFGGSLRNSAADRSYPFTYTISSADTWTQASVTVAGDTTGTWLTTNGKGITVIFGLGVGTDFSGTAGSWAGANYMSATGAVSVIGTLNATFYITGVQLEVGSVATEFERRPYGTELALCQRYYYKTNTAAGNQMLGNGTNWSGSTAQFLLVTPVPLRTTPSMSLAGTITASGYGASGGQSLTMSSLGSVGTLNGQSVQLPFFVVMSGTFGGYTHVYWYNSDTSSYLSISAEL